MDSRNLERGFVSSPEQKLGRKEWIVLLITLMFWVFDGYEVYAIILTVGPAVKSVLPAADLKNLPHFAGLLISIVLLGWATGGILGGVMGDRIGRRKTMIWAILFYAVFTGTSALTHSYWMLALTRFLTGIGIGAEWGVGTSLLAETWPAKYRTKGAGLLQSGFSVGALIASAIWWYIGGQLGLEWRWLFVVGVLPALIVWLLARKIPESYQWVKANKSSVKIAEALSGAYRRNIILALLVSIAITVGWWAVSSWVPSYIAGLAGKVGKNAAYYAAMAGILYNVGEIVGCIVYGFAAEKWGRKPTTVVYFVGSLIITPVIFLLVQDLWTSIILLLFMGYLTAGLYSWYTVHPPELFPTAVRATGISIVFNGARYLAMLGPIVSASLIKFFGGYGVAATMFSLIYILGIVAVLLLPETRNKPLPE